MKALSLAVLVALALAGLSPACASQQLPVNHQVTGSSTTDAAHGRIADLGLSRGPRV